MNILIPDSWLREHLKTKATPNQIAKYLSLCSQSVEKITKKGSDFIYEIEITANRPDCLSVYGIARELSAVLPQFNIKAELKEIADKKTKIPKIKKGLSLEVTIENSSLCPRFTAIIFDNITFKPSPKIIHDRLEKSGIRALNNVVDISNYLMLELGQPMHTFDYDKIKGAKMILRESKQGEEITTLDGINRKLPQGTIIIEDCGGKIIDLCGIMGGENSAVDKNTERLLLFVQIYDPLKIRQICQQLSFRTEASSRFEKGTNPEGIILAMKKAIKMFKTNCGAKVVSNLIDIYPNPPKTKKVTLVHEKLNQVMGIKIKISEAERILKSLGFETTISHKRPGLVSAVPHWRSKDISIPEDLIEEIARIYGYHKLPSLLPTDGFPEITFEKTFYWEKKVKDYLKNWGFTEMYTYSMQSKNLLEKTGIDSKRCLRIKNPLTKDLEYMRISSAPSILQTIADNQANFEEIKIFEMANIYRPRSNKLPEEKLTLLGAVTGQNKFYEAKGVVETLLQELGIKEVKLFPISHFPFPISHLWHPVRSASIINPRQRRVRLWRNQSSIIGIIGEIHPQVLAKFGINQRVTVFDLDFDQLVKLATTKKTYQPIPKYPPVIEDLSIKVDPKVLTGDLIEEIKNVSKLVRKVELIDVYQNSKTFRITYQDPKKTLSEKEVESLRKTVKKNLKEKHKAKARES